MLIIGIKKKDILNLVILGIYGFILLLSWLHLPITNTVRHILYPVLLILAWIYSYTNKSLSNPEKYVIRIMATMLFLRSWGRSMHLPIGNLIGLLFIIPIIWYIIVLFKKKDESTIELNFMTLLTGESLIILILIFKNMVTHG